MMIEQINHRGFNALRTDGHLADQLDQLADELRQMDWFEAATTRSRLELMGLPRWLAEAAVRLWPHHREAAIRINKKMSLLFAIAEVDAARGCAGWWQLRALG
jgi:hypothetical protein